MHWTKKRRGPLQAQGASAGEVRAMLPETNGWRKRRGVSTSNISCQIHLNNLSLPTVTDTNYRWDGFLYPPKVAHGKIRLTNTVDWIQCASLWIIWIYDVWVKSESCVLQRAWFWKWLGGNGKTTLLHLLFSCCLYFTGNLDHFFSPSCPSVSLSTSFALRASHGWRKRISTRTADFKNRVVTISSSIRPSIHPYCWVCWELTLISYADTPIRWPWSYQDRSSSPRNLSRHAITVEYMLEREKYNYSSGIVFRFSLHKPSSSSNEKSRISPILTAATKFQSPFKMCDTSYWLIYTDAHLPRWTISFFCKAMFWKKVHYKCDWKDTHFIWI